MGQPGHTPCELPSEAVERIPWLRRRLLSWFKRNGRSFPWRDPERTPYEVLVAEILLQRLALRLVSGKRSLQVNWAVLDFGALVCKAGRPRCQECPLRARCQYAGSPPRPTPTSGAL